jgi:cytochrome c nitrite reductase small subunit
MDAVYLFLGISLGGAAGLGAYTFIYAKGYSYLSNDPAVCANCHVMKDQFDGWVKSTHHASATCNDCHLPEGLVGKYRTKSSNGFWHSYYFTMDSFHEPIQIKPRNRRVAEANCRRCHQDVVHAMDGAAATEPLSCLRCHGSVGHPS